MKNIVSSWIDSNLTNRDIFLIEGGERYSYIETIDSIKKFAGLLTSRGIQSEDRIVLLLRNSFSFVYCYFGSIYTGATIVPLSIQSDPDRVNQVLKETKADLLIVEDRFIDKFEFDKERTVGLSEIQSGLCSQKTLGTPNFPRNGYASIMFTSGSTGQAKGVLVSHTNIQTNTDDIVKSLKIRSKDRAHLVLPLSYCFGTSILHSIFSVGASIVIDNRFMFPQKTLDLMNQHNSTIFAGVPSHYLSILNNTSAAKMTFPSLRLLQQAGGALSPEKVEDLKRIFCDSDFAVMYGQTEATARITILPPNMLKHKIGSVGKALDSVQLFVIDEDGHSIGPNNVGEICAKGRSICDHYLIDGKIKERESSFLKTGDLGYIDKDGFLFITGRKSQFIKLAGVRTSLFDLENLYQGFDQADGYYLEIIPDQLKGEAIKLYLLSNKDASYNEPLAKDAWDYYQRNLKIDLRPKIIEVINKKPLNDRGKVDFKLLKKSG